jgi:HlyD family secretion protein
MKKKIIIISSIVIGLAIISYFLFFRGESQSTKFSFSTVSRGNLEVKISSSGTLQAIKTVDVGTQVSGIIAKLLVDFNSHVKKGQLLAVLDTVVLAASVRDAEANLDKAKAQYEQAVAVHERNKQLYEKKFMNEVDFIASKTSMATYQATYKSATTALDRAKLNLNYAYIYAPISGTITNRAVEQGQTVAASFSAPTIFTIAEDLTSMRILASVDESDIGQIKTGQKVKFTVQSFQNRTFDGQVVQIRLNPTTMSNVVNYIVVVNAENKDLVLLPGMTATVDFYVDSREGVLVVPNIALRFQPTETMMEEYRKNMEKEMANLPDSVKKRFGNMGQGGQQGGGGQQSSGGAAFGGGGAFGGGAAFGGGNGSPRRSGMNRVWYFDEKNTLKMAMVFVGLSDGKNTEIVRGRNITEGMKVISGVVDNSTTAATSGTNVFNPTQNRGGAMGGPGGFGRGF